jgi:hypothetical protein
LEQSRVGGEDLTEAIRGEPYLASHRVASSSQRNVSAVQRSAAGRQGARYRGLYLNPPHHAVVLCVDEKSQIQALSRSQPILPMLPGQAERRTDDYKRYGTTSLSGALDIATGSVIGKCWPRHRAIELRKFLDQIDRAVPADAILNGIGRLPSEKTSSGWR